MLQTTTTTNRNRASLEISYMNAGNIECLGNGQEAEVIQFLKERPIHTVAMLGLIRDNGLASKLNRGNFYGYRDVNGNLEGVALVGHATLLETVSDRALRALARVARECPFTHMIMGEQDRLADLWIEYSAAGHKTRHTCSEWLFELRSPVVTDQADRKLQLATAAELDLVMPVQAELAFEESGINPLSVDPEGFRKRCLRRIEQGRTWVAVEDGKLIFKADIISQTAEVVYLEGIWICKEKRNSDAAVGFMSELSQKLLQEAKSICLLVNETNKRAQAFYKKCGFLFRATYKTIFLPQKERCN